MLAAGALMTMDELYRHLIDGILPDYHNTPHSGYNGKTPMELYQSLPKARNEVPDWKTMSAFMTEQKERTVTAQGLRFQNRLYWAKELMHMSGELVKVRYCRDDLSSVTVYTMDGRWVCEAEPKELLKMISEEGDKVARHVAMQKEQERELRSVGRHMGIRQPGKRASGSVYYEAVNEEATARHMPTSLQAHRAAKGKKAAKAAALSRKAGTDDATNQVRAMFRQMGDEVLRRGAQ